MSARKRDAPAEDDRAPPASERRQERGSGPPSAAPAALAATGRTAEIVVPLPPAVVALAEVRSTLLLASTQALRAGGYFDAYRSLLVPEHREAVLDSVAGSWVPVAAALAHYRACDALGLTSLEQMALGRKTGNGIRQHLTHAAGAFSRSVGISPWFIFQQFDRFWARSFRGGGVCVIKHGPKEAEVVYAKCVLLQSPYFRSALRGVAVGLLETVAQRSFMNELSFSASRHEARYRFSWV